MTIIDRMVPTDLADRQERIHRLRCLIACLQRDVDTQPLTVQVRRESLERIAAWTLAVQGMERELVRVRGY